MSIISMVYLNEAKLKTLKEVAQKLRPTYWTD